ncbi:MAG: PAS domain S-box protein [Methylotenera sp.]|nr:PAS domain S-box protein [Methylotenera sp.]MDP2153146.1 PAS domain S-box protein [Methylotenera sp.]MDP3059802.1 PAS domain S-box protein [Methylotenera sp.]
MKFKVEDKVLLLKQLGVAALYLFFGELFHHFIIDRGIVSILWPGSGLALAAVLIGGRCYLWGVLLGALMLNVLSGLSPWIWGGLTLVNVLEAYLGLWLLTRNKVKFEFNSLQNYLRLIGFGALASLAAGLIAGCFLLLAGFITSANYFVTALHWWMGDTLGIILLTPFLMSCCQKKLSQTLIKQNFEAITLLFITVLIGQIVFLGWLNEYLNNFDRSYLPFILVTLIAIRQNIPITTATIIIMACQALVGVYLGLGHFDNDLLSIRLQNCWIYVLTLSGVGVTLSIYVDEIRRKEFKLKLNELRLKEAQSVAQLGSWEFDLINNKLNWSDEIFKLFEIDSEIFQPSYQGFLDAIHPEDRDAVNQAYDLSLKTREPYEITHRLLMEDGRVKWVTERCTSYFNDDNKPVRSVGTVQDITEEYLAELASHSKDEQIRRFYELDLVGLAITSPDKGWIRINDYLCRMLEYSEQELRTMTWTQLTHPDDLAADLNVFNQLLANNINGYGLEKRFISRSGKVIPTQLEVRCSRKANNEVDFVVAMISDISDKVHAEAQLRLAATTFETSEAIMITDADANIVRVNKAFELTTGYTEAEVLGKNPRLLSSGEHDASFYVAMWDAINSTGSWSGEVWDKHKSGKIYPKKITITAIKNSQNITTQFVAIFANIFERKLAEAELQKTEQHFITILNSLNEVIWSASAPDFKIRHINAATESLYGLPAQAFLDDHDLWFKMVHGADKSRVKEASKQIFKTGQTDIEYRIVRSDGMVRWILDRMYVVYDENGNPAELVGISHDITQKKLTENSIHKNQQQLLEMLENSPIAVRIAVSGQGVRFANNRYAKLVNCQPDQVMGKDPKAFYVNPQIYESILDQLSDGQSVKDQLVELKTPGKSSTWAIASYLLMEYENKPAVLGWFYDITALKVAQESLRISEEKSKRSLEELKYQKFALDKHVIVAVTDINGRITYANGKFCEISGYSYEELIDQDHSMLNSGYHPKGFFREMYRTVSKGNVWHDEVCNRAKDGHIYWVDTTIAPYMGENGKPDSYISIRTDITQRKLAEEKSNYLALYDTLTQLPNRRLLMDRLNQALLSSIRTGRNGALLFLDLDNFKILNDTLGHDVGDMLLQQVGQRLKSCIREVDTVARLGGDEFVILIEDLSKQAIETAEYAEKVGKKMLTLLNHPYQLADYEYTITSSIGATLFKADAHSLEELLKQADIAMYQAKQSGRNALRFFDPQMQANINARADIERELRKAIEAEQMHLYYQVQVDSTGKPLGAEALIRWIHPERGMISPFHFIPLAEETGLILPIGQWVLETACAQLKAWEQNPMTREITLSVNVSAKQFNQPDFVRQVRATIQNHVINPCLLKLELTESIIVENINHIIITMIALKILGIKCSLDDFGTGYSSLQYLKKLPLDQLKIDQSFVRDLVDDDGDKAIVQTIINMANSLGFNVIAEGVETAEQRQYLLDNGCTHYQGYLFSKPVPIDEFEVLLNKN